MDIKNSTFIPTRQAQAQSEVDQKLRDAAQMYEQHFLGEMVKAMRQSVTSSDLVESSMGQKIYEGQLDQQYVEQWSQAGGVGLSEMIYQNIKEKYFPQQSFQKVAPGEMVPIEKKKDFMEPATDEQFKLKVEPSQTKREIQSPSDGKVISHAQIQGDLNQIIIDHENGVTSKIVYKGQPVALSGQSVFSGQKIAQLHPQTLEVNWMLSPSMVEQKSA